MTLGLWSADSFGLNMSRLTSKYPVPADIARKKAALPCPLPNQVSRFIYNVRLTYNLAFCIDGSV